jgi:hypothetical protein
MPAEDVLSNLQFSLCINFFHLHMYMYLPESQIYKKCLFIQIIFLIFYLLSMMKVASAILETSGVHK